METDQSKYEDMTVELYGIEAERILFLLKRDHLVVTAEFVERTMRLYRATVLRGFCNSGRLDDRYRRGFIESYLAFKRFYFDYKNYGLISQRPNNTINS